MAAAALADAALGDQIQDAALTVGIAGIPVLHGGVLDIGILLHNNFHHGGMQLLLVAHGRGAAFHIGNVRAFVGHDERTFELAGAAGVDTEIAAEFHGAAHPLGDVAERTVAENGRIQCGEVVVAGGDYAGQVLAHQVRVLLHGLGERTEDDAFLGQGFAEGGGDGHRVKDGVHGHDASQGFALLEGNAQFVESLGQFGIDLLGTVFVLLGSGKIDNVLKINGRHVQVRPVRHRHGLPLAQGVQAEFQQPLGFFLPGRYHTDDVFVQSLGNELLFNVCHKSFLVFSGSELLYDVFCHGTAKIRL